MYREGNRQKKNGEIEDEVAKREMEGDGDIEMHRIRGRERKGR